MRRTHITPLLRFTAVVELEQDKDHDVSVEWWTARLTHQVFDLEALESLGEREIATVRFVRIPGGGWGESDVEDRLARESQELAFTGQDLTPHAEQLRAVRGGRSSLSVVDDVAADDPDIAMVALREVARRMRGDVFVLDTDQEPWAMADGQLVEDAEHLHELVTRLPSIGFVALNRKGNLFVR